ncbi:MAG TPA: TolC family protein [Bacteroidales bacterium]
MKKRILIVFFTIIILPSFGQKIISENEAVNLALKNNYDILIARNDADIARINNTAGNAGMLPSAALNGSDNYALTNVLQTQTSGNQSYTNNSNSINAGLALDWTLFDGGKMFITKNKLSQIEALGEIQFRTQVLQTVYNVIAAYYDVVRQKQQLASINKVISYNQDRVNILQTSFNAGASAKNTLLQAKIDLNVSHENAIAQQSVIIAAKRDLNQLLSRNIDSTSYDVQDSIPLNYKPDSAELMQKIQANNTAILSFQKQMDIAKLSLDEMKSNRLPRINFNGGYSFDYTTNTGGTTLDSRTYGPQLGGSISVPLFQGGNINRQISTSKIQLQSAEYDFENTKIQIITQLQNALTDFKNQQNLLSIEQENSELVKDNLEIALQRLRLGQATALEVRQAQQSYEDSYTRLISFRYNLKVAETKLKQLMAGL